MYLIVTNVLSEARKGPRTNAGVRDFFAAQRLADLYICVQTIGEIRRGVENIRARGDQRQASLLESWFEKLFDDYGNRILVFDTDCAQLWGQLMSPHGANPVDKQIAAIALIYDLYVVTRNTIDFRSTKVKLLNPFS
jgi:predicted nucleic acid-binding protein